MVCLFSTVRVFLVTYCCVFPYADTKIKMRKSNKWLDAQAEHQSDLRTLPGCMSLCDLRSDDYHTLVVADLCPLLPTNTDGRSRLKVFKGTTLISEQMVVGIPSAVVSLYIDENVVPKVPVVAVAVGASVLFYRNMKPYYKWTLPSLPINETEQDIWRKLPTDKTENIPGLVEQLRTLDAKMLTQASLNLMQKPTHEMDTFIKQHSIRPLKRFSQITAMTSLRKSSSADDNGISYLVLVTESGDLFILDVQSFSVVQEARIAAFPATPTFVSATGHFDIDYRIVCATREGSVCLLRKTWLEGREILRLYSSVVGLALLPIDQTIIVICMNRSLDCYSTKGRRLWSTPLPEPALSMTPVALDHLSQTLVCVALQGGLVQLYGQKFLVDQFAVPASVSAMVFGKLGQEDYVLVLITLDGSLMVKILKRTADFPVNTTTSGDGDMPMAAGNLQIPKKSKVFVEQMTRERDNAAAIYANFHSELWRLRLSAARATVEVVQSADSTLATCVVDQTPIKLTAEVHGLGPVFCMRLTLENLSSQRTAVNLCVLLHADMEHYGLVDPYTRLPPIVPGVPAKIDFRVIAKLDPEDGLPPSDLMPENACVRVLVYRCGQVQSKPIIAATVAMPAPEPLQQ